MIWYLNGERYIEDTPMESIEPDSWSQTFSGTLSWVWDPFDKVVDGVKCRIDYSKYNKNGRPKKEHYTTEYPRIFGSKGDGIAY